MSRRVKKEKIDLLTTDLYYKVLVGESVLRFSFTKELLLEDEPARDQGKPFPLNNVVARVDSVTASINEKNKVNVQGSIKGKAVFYSKEGIKEIAWQGEEFYKETEFRGAWPGMEVTAHGRIVCPGEEDFPLEAEGKLLYQLKMEVEVLLAVVDPRQLSVAVGVKDIAPERVSRDTITAEELVSENTLSFNLTKEAEFAGGLDYTKIINSFLQNFSYEWNKDTLELRGELVVINLVLAEGRGSIQEIRQRFNQQIPFSEHKKGLQASLFPSIGEIVCTAEGEKINYHAVVDVFSRITRVVQQEVISDIQGVTLKKEYLLLPKVPGVVKEPLELVQKLAFPYPRAIAAGFCCFQYLNVNPQEDRLNISGVLDKKVYYFPALEETTGFEEGEAETAVWPAVLRVEDDFLSDLYLPGVGSGAEVAVYYQPQGTEFVPTENDTLQISHILLEIKARELQEIAVVVPSRVPPGTSMVVYVVRPDDTLLKIGRVYGLKSEAIAAFNGLEEDIALRVGQKLLIPLMFYSSSGVSRE